MIKLEKYRYALQRSWTKNTAFPPDQENWSIDNPTLGQCAVTSLIIQDKFGGKIFKNKEYNHYWNHISNETDIDLTKDQFLNSPEFKNILEASKKEMLRGEFASKYKTAIRYKELKKRVKNELKDLSPSLLLFSSNSSKEYILDILESIALPKGSIHHFRYQLRWLSQEVIDELKTKDETLSKELKNIQVIVAYLKQKKIDTHTYQWHNIIPLRVGKLIHAFKTDPNNNESSFAHFYFQLEEFIEYEENAFIDTIKLNHEKSYNKKLVLFDPKEVFKLGKLKSGLDIFNIICDTIGKEDFLPEDLDPAKKYSAPVYLWLDLLKMKRKIYFKKWRSIYKYVRLKRNKLSNQSYFELKEGTEYLFEFFTYFHSDKDRFTITLESDEKYFVNPKTLTLRLNSNYDQVSWALGTGIVERPLRTILNLKLVKDGVNGNNLDLTIPLEVYIKKKKSFRLLDWLGEVGFGLGTTALALGQMIEKEEFKKQLIFDWYIWLIIFYSVWIITNLSVKFWRDKQ